MASTASREALRRPSRKGRTGRARAILAAMLAIIVAAQGIAFPATASAESVVSITNTGSEYYDGFTTNYFRADGHLAFCTQPNLGTPNGRYAYDETRGSDGRGAAVICTAMILAEHAVGDGYGDRNDVAEVAAPLWEQTRRCLTMHNNDDSYYARMHVMLSYVFTRTWSGWCDPWNGTNNRSEWEEQSKAFYNLCSAVADGERIEGVSPEAVEALRSCAQQATVGVTRGGGNQSIAWLKAAPMGGYLEIVKESSNPELTQGNPCYSLAGAVYDVFRGSGERVCSITTDESGRASTGRIPYGDYYIIERSPSKGYLIDAERHPATLSSSKATVRVEEVPGLDPVASMVGKFDGERKYNGSANLPQGSATLAGAKFTVSWYPGYVKGIAPDGEGTYDWKIEEADGIRGNWTTDETSIAAASPMRTWTITTDEDGFAAIPVEERLQNALGQIGLPYGTVAIREASAPSGYLPSETIYVRQIEPGASATNVSTYNQPEVPEQVKRGDVSIMKFGETTTDEDQQPELKIPLAGVEFQLVSLNEGTVIDPNGAEVPEGGIVCTIRTDHMGWASTETIGLDGSPGALPFGRYEVREVASTVPEGYKRVEPFEIEIVDEGQVLRYTLEDRTGTAVRIVKKDAETGRQVSGRMTFRVLDAELNIVTFTSHYPTITVHSSFTTDSFGSCVLPEKLSAGGYYIQEVESPDGYVLGADPVPFSVDSSTVGSWNEPITVVVENNPQKGTIEIVKTDAETGGAITSSPASFAIEAAEDIVTPDGTVRAVKGEVVASVTTGEAGTARTGELYLGRYLVREVSAPSPYLLSDRAVEATLSFAGQSVSVTSSSVRFPDEQARGAIRLVKTDVETGEAIPIAGASFDVLAAEDVLAGDGAVLVEAGETVCSIETDAEGQAETEPLYLSTYEIFECAAPEGYVLSKEPIVVTLPYAGQETPLVEAVAEFGDRPQKATIVLHKHDSHSGDPVRGAVYEVRAATDVTTPDGTVRFAKGEVVSTMETDDAGVARSGELYLGTYEVVETRPPAGYALEDGPESIMVTLSYAGQEVEAFEERVDAFDAPTEVDIVKTRAGSNRPLKGVSFEWWPQTAEVSVEAQEGYAAIGACIAVPEGFEVSAAALVASPGAPSEIEVHEGEDEGQSPSRVDLEGHDGVWVASKAPYGSYLLEASVSKEGGEPVTCAVGRVDLTQESDEARLDIIGTRSEGDDDVDGLAWSVEETDVLVRPSETGSRDTDEEGRLPIRYLEPGTWRFRETAELPGYVPNDEVLDVDVSAKGLIEGKARFELSVENDYTKLLVSKRDIAGSEELPGAELEIRDGAGNVIESWTSGDEPHMIEELPTGDYVLSERSAPKDYSIAEDVPFTVEETGEVQEVVMFDEAIPGTLASVMPKTGDPAPFWVWLVAAAIAGGAVLGLSVARARDRKGDEEDGE